MTQLTLSAIASEKMKKEHDSFWSLSKFVFIKNMLFFVNLIALVSGFALLSLGVAMGELTSKIDFYGKLAIAVIMIGVIVILMASFGCIAALSQKRLLLKTYAVVLFVVILLQYIIGTLAVLKVRMHDFKF